MHEDFLSGLDRGAIDQPLPRGDRDERERRSLAHRQVAWFQRQQVGIDRGKLGQRALQPADATGEAVDLVARLESRHPGPDRLHRAGQIGAEHRREGMAGMSRGPGPDFQVERIDAAGVDLHEDLSRAGLWAGQQIVLQGTIGHVNDAGAHEVVVLHRDVFSEGEYASGARFRQRAATGGTSRCFPPHTSRSRFPLTESWESRSMVAPLPVAGNRPSARPDFEWVRVMRFAALEAEFPDPTGGVPPIFPARCPHYAAVLCG